MATKKLTAELDIETAKAKQKLHELENSGGQSVAPQVESAADRMAKAMDKATVATQHHAEAAEQSSGNLTRVLKSFSGMAIGMAMSYARNNMEDGPAKTALGYGASMAKGAAMGMMFGPWGAAAGAALGAGQEFIDEDAQKKAQAKADQEASEARKAALKSQEESIKRTREWKATIDALTNTETNLAERQRELQTEIAKREEEEQRLKAGMAGEAGLGGDDKNFNRLSAERGKNAAEIDALKALAKQLEKEGKKERGGSAADYSAFDSLARIGGNFAGSDQGFRDLQRTNEAQLETLKSIERKTGKGGTF